MAFFRKFVSLVLCLILVTQCMVTLVWASDSNIIVNESFNSYVTNEVPIGISVIGNKNYVTEYSEKEKGYRFDLNNAEQTISFPAKLSKDHFVSFDILATGKINGALNFVSGTSTVPFKVVSFADGKIKSHNGKEIGGVVGKMRNISVYFDFANKLYTVYQDGKALISDYYISGLSFSETKEVSLTFSSSVGASVIVDNINIGNGKPIKKYPVSEYNPNSVELVEYVPKSTEDIYLKVNLEPGSKLTAAYNNKENIMEPVTDDDGNTAMHLKRTSGNDFHLDCYISSYPSDYLVYQYDIKLASPDVFMTNQFKSSDQMFASYCLIDNGVLTAGNKRMNLSVEKWYTISAVYDKYNSLFDIYVDGELFAKDVPCDPSYKEEKANIWRFHTGRYSGIDEYYMDNFAIYGGTEPRDISNVTFSVSEETSAWDKDDKNIAFLNDKVSYHLKSGVTYADGEKQVYAPLYVGDVAYVPAEFFKSALKLEVSYDSASNTATVGSAKFTADSQDCTSEGKNIKLGNKPTVKDGVMYLPLKDTVVDVFGKKFFLDTTCQRSGLVLISDSEVKIPEGFNLQSLSDFALYERPDMAQISADFEKSGYAGVHPRVLADESDFVRIRSLAQTDERMKLWSKSVISRADETVRTQGTLVYELRDGVRLWYVSLDFIERISVLAMAYQLTGDKKYSDRAWLEMNSIANFPSWHPEHSIDVGAMAVGYAIGYDWLYDTYTPEQREIIEQGAYNNGFYAYIEGFQGRQPQMVNSLFEQGNHCMVMQSGASMLGAAFYDKYPEYSSYCISASIRSIEYGLSQYDPSGSWFEGIGYAAMTLRYLTYQLATLKEIFGDVYSLDKTEGLENVVNYFLNIQSPQGAFGFQDGSSQNITTDTGIMWIGSHFGQSKELSTFDKLFGFPGDFKTMLWYNPDNFKDSATLPLDGFFADQQVITTRDSWDKNFQTAFAGIKGGTAGGLYIGHGHLDLGTFTFYANSTQWTHDFSSEDYNVPGYWSGENIDSLRWQYYRTRAEGHNCFIVDPDYNAEYNIGFAPVTKLEQKPRGVIGIIDMTEVNYGKVASAKRGFYFADDRRSIVIRDEVVPNKESTMYWFMHTMQEAKVEPDGKTVTLTQKGNPLNTLKLEFMCNADIEVKIVPAAPLPTSPHPDKMTDDSANHKIQVKIVSSQPVNLTAKLTPGTTNGARDISEFHIPMDTWTIPDGEIPERPILDYLSVDGVEYPVSSRSIVQITPENSTTFADIQAVSSRYNVDIKYPQSINDTAVITLTHPNDSTVRSVYKINYKPYKTIGVDGITEYAIVKVEASDEPQPENGIMNIIDRDPTTRWSSTGSQYITIDMSKVVEFNTIYMNFMEGNQRKNNLSISVSEDGIEYKEVFEGTSSGTNDDYEAFNLGTQRARYIKIFGNGSNVGEWNSWEEVAVVKK